MASPKSLLINNQMYYANLPYDIVPPALKSNGTTRWTHSVRWNEDHNALSAWDQRLVAIFQRQDSFSELWTLDEDGNRHRAPTGRVLQLWWEFSCNWKQYWKRQIISSIIVKWIISGKKKSRWSTAILWSKNVPCLFLILLVIQHQLVDQVRHRLDPLGQNLSLDIHLENYQYNRDGNTDQNSKPFTSWPTHNFEFSFVLSPLWLYSSWFSLIRRGAVCTWLQFARGQFPLPCNMEQSAWCP